MPFACSFAAAVWSTQDYSRPPWSLFYQKWIGPFYTQLGMPAIDTDLHRASLIERFEHVFPRSGPVNHRELSPPNFIVSATVLYMLSITTFLSCKLLWSYFYKAIQISNLINSIKYFFTIFLPVNLQ